MSKDSDPLRSIGAPKGQRLLEIALFAERRGSEAPAQRNLMVAEGRTPDLHGLHACLTRRPAPSEPVPSRYHRSGELRHL